MSYAHELSERARRFLQRVGASRAQSADVAGTLGFVAAQGLPVFPALRDFESEFGGLQFVWRRHDVVLGIACMRERDEDLHAGPDNSRVLIGRADEWIEISMSPDGRLWSHGPDDAPWELASSPATYLEHLALLASIPDWCDEPFRVVVEPIGAKLAQLLDMSVDAIASDDHDAVWTSDACWLLQKLKGDPYATSFASLLCRDIEVAADTLLRLQQARPELRIQVGGCERGTTEEHSRHGYAKLGQIPAADSWACEPNAVRFAYLGDCMAYLGSPDDVGVVWLFGEPGARRFEQYVRPGSDPGGGFVEWASFGADRAVLRRFLPVYPPKPPPRS